ncbi:hypothetical protein [Nostoc sp. FACHB-892]|uniref:hypothetical protein n=1 Tax=Nostoc sp. FACHB-892 TaxID=2692843 RepID=UPI0016858675|nr:hypothetical protein [Nostoc sp. FACHB-892]
MVKLIILNITLVLDPQISPAYVVADLYSHWRRYRIEEAFCVVKRLFIGTLVRWVAAYQIPN